MSNDGEYNNPEGFKAEMHDRYKGATDITTEANYNRSDYLFRVERIREENSRA